MKYSKPGDLYNAHKMKRKKSIKQIEQKVVKEVKSAGGKIGRTFRRGAQVAKAMGKALIGKDLRERFPKKKKHAIRKR